MCACLYVQKVELSNAINQEAINLCLTTPDESSYYNYIVYYDVECIMHIKREGERKRGREQASTVQEGKCMHAMRRPKLRACSKRCEPAVNLCVFWFYIYGSEV